MEKITQVQNARAPSEQAPHLSFREVSLSGIRRAIPQGYRLPTLSEASRMYKEDAAFRADVEKAGSIWVLGMAKDGKATPVCTRAYNGLFRMDDPAYHEDSPALHAHYRPVTNTAHVAYVRNRRVQISRQSEMMENFKNALRREVHAVIY